MDIRRNTLTALRAAKQEDLDREWRERYPEGQYALLIQEVLDPGTVTDYYRKYLATERRISLARITERNTSRRTRGLSGIQNYGEDWRRERPRFKLLRIPANLEIGWKERRRGTWESFVKLCHKEEVPKELLQHVADLWDKEVPTRP